MSSKPRIVEYPFDKDDSEIPPVEFSRILFENMRRNSTSVAAVDVLSGHSMTYSEFIAAAENIARHLTTDLGCRRNDVIAMFSPNSIEWLLMAAAAFRIGAIPSGFNCLLTTDEVKTHLKLSGANYLYTVNSLAAIALEAAESFQLKAVIVRDGYDGCVSYSTLTTEDQSTILPSFDELRINPSEDVALILFSSGTSGIQKGILLTHRNLQLELVSVLNPLSPLIVDVNFAFVPFVTIIGFIWSMFPLAAGKTVHVLAKFNLSTFLRHIERARIEFVTVVPPVAVMLAKSPEPDAFDLSSLRRLMIGGAPVARSIEDQLLSRYPHLLEVCRGYGMSEVGGSICSTPVVDLSGNVRRHSSGSVGMPLMFVKVKVVDPETGVMLGPNEDGELCVRSPTSMKGYANNPQATASTIDKDGWLHTGDVGHYDEDGYFFVVDRLKDLIKYNAYQVSPIELESVLISHPDVADAGVVGLPHEMAGELPLAFVVKKPGSEVTESELQEFVSKRVAAYKRLRGGIVFAASIPKTGSGKILRRYLRKSLLAGKL